VRRRYSSEKRFALQRHYGKPWDEVALEFDARPLRLDEIAAQWQREVGTPYTKQDVSRAIRRAREIREGVTP
jgi:transposase